MPNCASTDASIWSVFTAAAAIIRICLARASSNRKPTQGNRWNNDNNYPLLATHTLGIHNGTIYNDDALFASLALPRQGEVDSGIIFRILDTVDPSSRNGQYLNTVKVTLVVHL